MLLGSDCEAPLGAEEDVPRHGRSAPGLRVLDLACGSGEAGNSNPSANLTLPLPLSYPCPYLYPCPSLPFQFYPYP